MSGQQNQQPAGPSGPNANSFRPQSLQNRLALIPTSGDGRRAADSAGVNDGPEARRSRPEESVNPDLADYEQACDVPNCVHVEVYVGNPAVKFTLCKNRLQHASQYFRVALDPDSNFTEGQNLVIVLVDCNPDTFLLYIKTIFPSSVDDYEALPISQPTCEAKSATVTKLLELFHNIDRFGSLSCASAKQRVLKSLRLLRSTNIAWSQAEKMRLVRGFSTFNMDEDSELMQELLMCDFVIDDVDTMKQIKPNILHQIMAKAAARLTSENDLMGNHIGVLHAEKLAFEAAIRSKNQIINSPTTLRVYCSDCRKFLFLGKDAYVRVDRVLECNYCHKKKVMIIEQLCNE